jgi:hypothetical protein
MTGHADPLRKQGVAAAPAQPHFAVRAMPETAQTRALAATGRLLNARPALVAQRALAATLARRPRGIIAAPPVAPVQLMNNGQAHEDEEWNPFPAPGGQQAGGQGGQANQPGGNGIADDEWGAFQGAGDQIAELEWGPFQGAGDQPPAANGGADDWADFGHAFGNQVAPVVGQQPNPHAGHGLEVGIGDHAADNGLMYTTGLFNCIALVAYDPETPLACLYHWNTAIGAFMMDEGEEDDDGEMHYGLIPNPDGIAAAKAVVDGGAPGATAYHAVFGRSWGDAELAPKRPGFAAALAEIFPGITIFATPQGSARWAPPDLIGYG